MPYKSIAWKSESAYRKEKKKDAYNKGLTFCELKWYFLHISDLERANYHICEISNYLLILLPLKKQKEQNKNLAPFSIERIYFFFLEDTTVGGNVCEGI